MSQVLERALDLVDLVAHGHNTLSDLCQTSGLTRSTTHRLLSTLVERGYLELSNRHYQLGHRLLELGEKKRASFDFVHRLHSILTKYAHETRDTIHLAILDSTEIMLIECVRGARELQINSHVGMRNIAITTAVGKALISKLDPSHWQRFLASAPQNYPKTEEELHAELESACRNGIAIDFDECNIGTCGIASSFLVNTNTRVACSINGATLYFGDGRMSDLAPVVRELASELEAAA